MSDTTQATGSSDAQSAPSPEPEAAAQAAQDVVEQGPDDAGDELAAAPAEPLTPEELALRIEAILIATDKPLTAARLGSLLDDAPAKAITAAVDSLNEVYEGAGRSFRIENVAGGWQILTLPKYKAVLAALHRAREETRLGPAAMETLAIIAYKQPILRAQVEAIRGVACGEVIRGLMERRLVKIVGRAEEIGRPILYGTTRSFLEVFGLASLKDLPKVEELKPKA
ncbi:MAG: SMC-Scp complex subunit ScpB [Planctomycetota bacterium]|nr:SMC-Scp complex subunit ScpB [Planctomycetota bacterium]